jgi:PhnB protein
MTKFNPYLNFAGNTEQAFNFYKSVFGGEFASLVRFKDMPMQGVSVPPDAADKIMHVGLPVGNGQMLMGTDAIESLGHRLVEGNNVQISLHPDSKEEADRLFNALSEGGKVQTPMSKQPWGDYYGNFQDKFGIYWMINYHM